jgi:hypothetical protein
MSHPIDATVGRRRNISCPAILSVCIRVSTSGSIKPCYIKSFIFFRSLRSSLEVANTSKIASDDFDKFQGF